MEKRKTARTSLLTDCHSQFRLEGQTYTGIRVANLGARGCCLHLPPSTARHLKDRPFLENLELFQGGSRKPTLRGRIAWFDERPAQKGAYIQAGVEFLEAPEECTREISAYVMGLQRT
jgi:hypothetical protein